MPGMSRVATICSFAYDTELMTNDSYPAPFMPEDPPRQGVPPTLANSSHQARLQCRGITSHPR